MSGFTPIRYSSGNITGSGEVMTKGEDNWLFSNESESACKAGKITKKRCFVLCYDISSPSTASMLISQSPFRRIRSGISETHKHFKILASDVYTFSNRAAGVT